MTPLISIITPSYNQGRFIERTVLSVIGQHVSGLEYVVIDGGSTDQTLEILKRYDDRLNWVSEKDRGQADAVNKGIKMTRGDIIGWLNSDDIYYPGALSAVISFFDSHPGADIVYGRADQIDIYDRIIEPYHIEDWNYERLKETCYICQPAVFFRRKVVERFGVLDDRLQYCMDYEYWLRLGKILPFFKTNSTLAGSRIYKETKTLGERIAVHKEINDMFKKRLGSVPSKWIFNYAHAIADENGYDRMVKSENFKYVTMLIYISILSFLKWRIRPDVSDIKTIIQWAVGAAKVFTTNWK